MATFHKDIDGLRGKKHTSKVYWWEWNACCIALSVFILAVYFNFSKEMSLFHWIFAVLAAIISYMAARRVFVTALFSDPNAESDIRLCWRWFIPAWILIAFLIPAKGFDVLRSIEIENLSSNPSYNEYAKMIEHSEYNAIIHLSKAIISNPFNFIKNYISAMKNALKINIRQRSIRKSKYTSSALFNKHNLRKQNTGLNSAFARFVESHHSSAAFRPWFILLSSITIFGYLYMMRRDTIIFEHDRKVIYSVNISALVFLFFYIPLEFVPSYSYYYWPSVANWFCISYLFLGATTMLANKRKIVSIAN